LDGSKGRSIEYKTKKNIKPMATGDEMKQAD
jgi:hypothetical protein